MAAGAALNQLIVSTINNSFASYTYDELVIGKLAKTDFKENVKNGTQVDILMPTRVSITKGYDGGAISEAEKIDQSRTSVFTDEGYYFNFGIDDMQLEEIKRTPDKDKLPKIQELTTDAYKQVSAAIDESYGKLYHRAGIKLDNNGSAITLKASNAPQILAYMETKFKQGDGNGHTNWINGKMAAILPPAFTYYLVTLDSFKFTERGNKKIEAGFIGELYGWKIYESNNIASPETDVYYPLFGVLGATLAGAASKTPKAEHYRPHLKFQDCYKGFGFYGVGAPRADMLGTAAIKAPLTITTT